MARHYLFLQGATSFFFKALAKKLRERGHATSRINFNVGDVLFWLAGNASSFRGASDELGLFLKDYIIQHEITDVIMHGDTRPEHRNTLQAIKELGVVAHIFEEGYFRPGWLTLERWGINGNSRLPKQASWYRDVAKHVPEHFSYEKVCNPISILGAWDVAYHLPNLLNPILYPHYKTNRPAISGVEFYGWVTRFSKMPYYARRDDHQIKQIKFSKTPFFLVPLQLDGDAQLIHHSPFDNMHDFIVSVLTSFAEYAQVNAALVIKNHPLDTGLKNYAKTVSDCAKLLDISSRVYYLETGNLDGLLEDAIGVVTVNSTVGTAALAAGRPVIALGSAIYDVDGLVYQGDLDTFWHDAQAPDASLYHDFRRVVIHTTQVNGGFYTSKGNRLATENAIQSLEATQSPLERFL
jgi:capsular polysaccharide export protein